MIWLGHFTYVTDTWLPTVTLLSLIISGNPMLNPLKLFARCVILHDFCLLIFSPIFFSSKTVLGVPSECHTDTVWIQIRFGILLGLVWVQTACKAYRQTTKVDASRWRDSEFFDEWIYFFKNSGFGLDRDQWSRQGFKGMIHNIRIKLG